MGGGGVNAGDFIKDPASSFVTATSSFSRARSMSACIQLDFLGKISDAAGQVCIVKNISLAAFNYNSGTTGAAYRPMTVDEIFLYAAERGRFQIGGHEAVWRPGAKDIVFRDAGNQSSTSAVHVGDTADTCWTLGSAAVSDTVERVPNPNEINGFIIAWKGLNNAAASNSNLVFTKTFELELAPRSLAIEGIPRQVDSESSESRLAKVLQWLDSMMPNWQSRVMTAGTNAVGDLARAYAPDIVRRATPAIQTLLRGQTSLMLT